MQAVLALMLTTTLAAQEGFGGRSDAPALSAFQGDEAPCRVQLDDGRWVTCADILSESAAPASRSAPAPKDFAAGKAQTERPPLEVPDPPQVRVESVEPDFEAELDAQRFHYDKGPWGSALKRASKERELSLLGSLRRQVSVLERKEAWYRNEVEARRRAAAEHEVVRQELLAATTLLTDVEVLGLRLRQACADRLGDPEALPPERMPVGMRLTLAQPLIKSLLLTPDPKECDREVLVTEAVIARARELQLIEQRLKTETFGYFKIDERRRLEARRTALVDELEGKRALGGIRQLTVDDGMEPLKGTLTEPAPLRR
jgi:hypothetical protein